MTSVQGEELELDLSKSEFLTEDDKDEAFRGGTDTFGAFPTNYRPRSSRLTLSDAPERADVREQQETMQKERAEKQKLEA